MARRPVARRLRPRGEIEALPSGSLRVSVYAGVDPVTKRRHRLREIIPAGPKAADEAEKTLRRLLVQIDEQRSPRTSATVGQLLERHFELLEVEPGTLATYRTLAAKHIVPLIGNVKVGALRAAVFDSFYAELRRCRAHCDRRPSVEHRTMRAHRCDARCAAHVCRPLSRATVRQIHVILSGALKRAVRWGWIAGNPIEHAEPPPQPAANPQPPTPDEAARILNAAWEDPDWAVLVWLSMVTGSRRGELCALRWLDVDLSAGVLVVQRSVAELDGTTWEKDTKTHQHRRLALDPETVALLAAHRERCADRCATLGLELADDAYVFSAAPDGSTHLKPSTVSRRYSRLARRLGIQTTFHKLRHYSATELISAGVDVRTVAGRLGHGGGGTTTLRVYAAWVAEADQRASASLLTRLPARPAGIPGSRAPGSGSGGNPYQLAAADLRAQILDGRLPAGSLLPPVKSLAQTYGLAVGTAHRALVLLAEWELIDVGRGRRAVVLAPPAGDGEAAATPASESATPALQDLASPASMVGLEVRRRGALVARLVTDVDPHDLAALRRLLLDAVQRDGRDASDVGDYEMAVREPDGTVATFVLPAPR